MRQLPKSIRCIRPLSVLLIAGILCATSTARAEEPKAPDDQLKTLPPGIVSALQARAYAHFCSGMDLMLSGDTEAAALEFEKVVGLDPDAQRAWFHLGSLQRTLGDYDRSIECFRKATEFDASDFRSHFELGRVLLLAGKVENGILAWENAAERADGRTAVYIYERIAKYYERGANPQKAIEALSKALEASDAPRQTAKSLLVLQERYGDWSGAVDTYEKLLKLEPDAHQLHVNIAECYEQMGNWSAAVGEYDAFFAGNQPDLDHYVVVISALNAAEQAGQQEKINAYLKIAIDLLDKALTTDESGNAVFSLTRTLTRSGHSNRAIELLTKGLEEAPEGVKGDIHAALATVYLWQAQPNQAENQLLAALQAAPENALLHAKLGDLYRDLFQFSKAAEQYRLAIEHADPAVKKAYHATLADIYIDQKEYAKAEEQTKAVISEDPGNGAAWAGYGQVRELAGDLQKAAEGYEKALELGAPDPMVAARWRVKLADLYKDQNKPEKRAEQEKALLKLADNTAAVLPIVYGLYELEKYNLALQILVEKKDALNDRLRNTLQDILGRLYEKTGQTEKAHQLYQQNVAKNPENAWSKIDLANHLARQKKHEEAIELLKTVLKDANADSEAVVQARLTIADALDSLGKIEEAKATYEKLAEEHPDYPSVNNNVAYFYAVQGINIDVGLEMVKKALSSLPAEPAYLDTYGWLLYRKGEYDGALMTIHQAWYKQKNSEIAEHLGDVLLKLGRDDLALQIYKEGLESGPDASQIEEKIRNIQGKIHQTKAE